MPLIPGCCPSRSQPVPEARSSAEMAALVVTTVEEFDRMAAQTQPDLLERATSHTRGVLRETGQWSDYISHEELALRWGYDLLGRYVMSGRSDFPCRPS